VWAWWVSGFALLAVISSIASAVDKQAGTEQKQALYSTSVAPTVAAQATAASVALPTAMPAPPPTTVPASAPRAYNPLPGSWVAFSPEINVRFFSPFAVIEIPDQSHRPASYHLRSPSQEIGRDFEKVDIYRARNQSGGESTERWILENNAFLSALDAKDYSVTFGPTPQQIGDYLGQRGQFNYAQADNGIRISGTMWVGQVGADVVVIVYSGEPAQEYWIDRGMTQIMDTIDFNAH
jgi:hypothetical protein